jgi:hypothetical protein
MRQVLVTAVGSVAQAGWGQRSKGGAKFRWVANYRSDPPRCPGRSDGICWRAYFMTGARSADPQIRSAEKQECKNETST